MTMLSDGMLLGAGQGPTPLVFVGAETTSREGHGTFNVNLPAGTQAGDRVLISIMSNSQLSGASAVDCTTVVSNFSSVTLRHALLTKIASGGEGGVVSVTTTSVGSTVTHGIHVVVYRGGNANIDAAATGTVDSSATSTAPSVTASVDGTLVAFFGSGPSFTISTPPAGMTQRVFSNTLQAHAVYELSPSPSGSTGAKNLVWSASNFNTRGTSVHIN